MSVTTVARPTRSGLQLPLLPEPVALKRALRALAEEAPERAVELLGQPDEVVAFLWERWGADLEPAGIGPAAFLEIVAEYRRELWYWIWGNRTWAQCVQGLAGRLARRVVPWGSEEQGRREASELTREHTRGG